MNRRLLALLGGLLAFGAVKVPLEQHLQRTHRAAFFHGAKLDLGLREQIGQMAFLAALSGFRALVADALYLHAFAAFERTEWGRVKLDFDAITSLQPRCVLFWDQAAWHMAYNASVWARENPRVPREGLRIKAQREYFRIGEDFLLRGIANNPDRALLYQSLGTLYRDKYDDHCRAADAFDKCAQLPKAPQYIHRFAAYEMAQCPGREQEAYERLLALYHRSEDERLPTLLKWLGRLQEKLNVPPERKVYIPPPAKP